MIGEPVWPVDLGEVRIWPLEGEDGLALQKLFDDLADFRTPFGEPGSADAVSTFLALPEGHDYDAKLLLGLWRNDALTGALDCIIGYPTRTEWTIGLLVVADRHRGHGIASAALEWIETAAADHGVVTVRAVLREANDRGIAFARSRGYRPEDGPALDPGHVVLARPTSARSTPGPDR